MNDDLQMSILDAIQKLAQYGLKECTEEMRSKYNIECLYAFDSVDDETSACLICDTEADVFALLSMVEELASQ